MGSFTLKQNHIDPVVSKILLSDKETYTVNKLLRFVASETVGEKSRISLARRLSGQYVELACNKQGSFAVQKLWNAVPMKFKKVGGDSMKF